MSAPRIFQLGLRRAGLQSAQVTSPASRALQRRFAATLKDSVLIKQRLARPVSPHLTIYQPQITWIGSSLHRITGVVLSGSLYLFGLAYLVAPAAGWHLETPSLVAAVASWPVIAKVSAKFALAWPFVYHSVNGLRHLAWDFTIGITNKAVMRSGWAAVVISIAATLGLTFL